MKILQRQAYKLVAIAKNVRHIKAALNNPRSQAETNKFVWDTRLHQESDLFLVSYPRSGNTWMRYMMTNLRFPDATWNLQSLGFAFPEIYSSTAPSSVPFPRWIKSHHHYTSLYPKVIYLIRDGRDVAVSYYFWSGHNNKESFSDFVEKHIFADNSLPYI